MQARRKVRAMQRVVRAAVLAIGGYGGAPACAQSSVTLYGLVDTAVRYTTHADSAGNARLQVANGGVGESHWGVKGLEDLGGGNRLVFQLENRFFLNTGETDPAYPFFNMALVGLQLSTGGLLTLGRQTNPIADAVLRTFISNPWLPTVYQFRPEVGMAEGAWTSNMVKYAAQWRDLTVELSYVFGGGAGAFGAGSQIGASIAYVPAAPWRFAAGYLDLRDAVNASAHLKAWTAGGAYRFGSTSVNAGWVVNRQDPGFMGNVPNGPFTPAQLTALKFNTFSSREMYFGGVTQQIGASLHVSANLWRTLQSGKVSSGDGHATQFQLLGDYQFSRTTAVYLEGDYAWYRGGMVGAQLQGFNGASAANGTTQLGMMAGVRHMF
jgi:predicted porin